MRYLLLFFLFKALQAILCRRGGSRLPGFKQEAAAPSPRSGMESGLPSTAVPSPEDTLRRWHSLTPRQKQVARLIVRNLPNSIIAGELSVSLWTVKSHVRSVLGKFGVRSKTELRDLLVGRSFIEGEDL